VALENIKLISREKPLYLPFASSKYRMSMGLNALRIEKWIEPDEYFHDELQEKEKLLENRYQEIFSSNTGSFAPQREVLALLLGHMTTHYSGLLNVTEDEVGVDGSKRCYSRRDFENSALDLCGRLVQEDFCLMAPGKNGYTLEAASLCFPSRWRLLDKMGLPMRSIHNPVPEFSDKLAAPVDRFFDYLTVARPVWRVNWSVTTDPNLYQPIRRQNPERDVLINESNAGDRIFIRCERQTLRRLSESGWILFTIKTYLDKVSTLTEYPQMALNFASLLRDLPEPVLIYKNILPFKEPLLEYLDKIGLCTTSDVGHN